ncbi:ABC transporter permease [Mumia sp. DW29H23]|uniref:ABC transporter permease n=1 Tax=Mumia sp. DW29H23 TaxID=3421241 RepID=UPI003D68C459
MTVVRPLVRTVGPILLAGLVVVVLWMLFLAAFPEIGPRVGQTPQAVWDYLFAGENAAANRELVLGDLAITLRDAGWGFAAGMAAALVMAALFVLAPVVEQATMPVAMILRSVPLVAMTPVIALVFGRGQLGVAVLGGIVVFFPALVTIVLGLRSASRQSLDVVAAYGGSRWTALRTVAVPSATPSIFAAARLSVPAALIGALVAEWLASGEGLGSSMIKAIPAYAYDQLWASIVVVTATSIVLYAVVSAFESVALVRFGQVTA